MPFKPGIRVGAMSHATENTLYIFGYGVYEQMVPIRILTGKVHEGYKVPDPALLVQVFGELMVHETPSILLDSGKRVFGCECWWGPEDKIREMAGRYTKVVEWDIEVKRKEYAPFGVRFSHDRMIVVFMS